jgi:type IV pilus assembly protein PilC
MNGITGEKMEKDFFYRAKDIRGETVNGIVSGKTSEEVAMKLHFQNLIVLEILEKKKTGNLLNKELKFRCPSFKDSNFSRFCRQFHMMLGSGIPILKCLELIRDETGNKYFAEDLDKVCSNIQAGENLSEAMKIHPKSFPQMFVYMVEAGEVSGNLTEVILAMAEYYETEERNRRELQQILFYPLILCTVFGVVLFFLLTYVLPTFVEMFEVMAVELPVPTKILLGISHTLTHQWFLILLVVAGVIMGFYLLWEIPGILMVRDRIRMKIPLWGALYQKRSMTRIASTLGMFLSSGIDLLTALERLGGVAGNRYLEWELKIIENKVAGGSRLARAMTESGVFPVLFCQMVAIGEESGTMPEVLKTIDSIYRQEIGTEIQAINTSLEPIILLAFGGLVLFMLAAIMLPVFDIYGTYSSM